MSEVPLEGGDVNVVVRVGDTVRRPQGPWSPAVHALLSWYERCGFDGAPRFLGVDEHGREILSFIEGEPAFAPVPVGDDVIVELGRLLRRAHDAQDGFVPPPGVEWQRHVAGLETGEVIGHLDLFWTNVVFRDGRPVALIDWDLAAPATRALEVALAATYWAPLRIDEQAVEWGLQLDRRGERLRLLCDAYGLDAAARATLIEQLTEQRRGRLARWDEWHPAGTRELVVANLRWLEAHRSGLARFLA